MVLSLHFWWHSTATLVQKLHQYLWRYIACILANTTHVVAYPEPSSGMTSCGIALEVALWHATVHCGGPSLWGGFVGLDICGGGPNKRGSILEYQNHIATHN
jgi:hypothetical protein